MRTRVTEREVSGWIADTINDILSRGGYPFEMATVEPSIVGRESRFPDVVLWLSRERDSAFVLMELKPPGGTEDLNRLKEKTQRLNIEYCVTYNFEEGVLYQLSDNELVRIKIYPTYVMDSLEKWRRGDIQARLKEVITIFLEDFNTLYQKGHLHSFIPDKVFFVSLFRESVDKLSPAFKEYLCEKAKDREIKAVIEAWAFKQGMANVGDEEFYEVLSRQWAYNLMTKILFYLALRRYYSYLPDILQEFPEKEVGNVIYSAFGKARTIDWHAVFEESPLERIGLPEEAGPIIRNLLKDLTYYHFGVLKEDVIGEIFEELIPYEERHDLGQYFTREDLVDFIIGFVAHNPDGIYGDPTCGSGTFLNRLYSRLKYCSGYKLTHKELLSKLWGVEIANFPASLATVNLFRQDIRDYRNFPHIIPEDFFKVNPGDKFYFPPPKVSEGEFEKIEEEIPLFDGLVGNFPYIRQELIEKKVKGYKNFLTKVIANDWLFEYPEVFEIKCIPEKGLEEIKNITLEKRKAIIEEWVDKGYLKLKLSKQADIYAYLFFHAGKFLKEGGRMGIVTSNSWLDVAYGVELKKFFLKKFKIIAIVGSWVEPWFEDASVNTIFTILERCDDEEKCMNHNVKFVKLKKPLKELIPEELMLEEHRRWRRIETLVRKIENSDIEFIEIKDGKRISTLEGIHSIETEEFRIRLVKQKDLLEEIEEKGELAKWGKYLRAPDVYFEIMEKVQDKLIPLKEIAEVRRGYTTGINDFFYLQPTEEPASKPGYVKVKNARGWVGEIEEEFLKPVLKSPKESNTIVIHPSKLKCFLFVCNYEKQELKRLGKYGALEYIEWGETQKTKNGTSWPDVPSARTRKYWWAIEEVSSPIVYPSTYNPVFKIFMQPNNTAIDKVLYAINPDNHELTEILCALLNSSLLQFFIEIYGYPLMGGGGVFLAVYELAEIYIPNPFEIPPEIKGKILEIFQKIKNRNINFIFEEIKMEDRKKLDSLILQALGLDPEKYLPEIYKGITELVRERRELPKMRKKIKKQRTKRTVEEIKKTIEKEVLPGGIRKFPESFLDLEKEKVKEISVTGKPLKIGKHFMGTYEIIDEEGKKIYSAGDRFEARFIIYSYKPGEYVIKIPENKKVIQDAIKEYEKYLKSIKERLVTRAFEATHDHAQAERIANEILKEHGVRV